MRIIPSFLSVLVFLPCQIRIGDPGRLELQHARDHFFFSGITVKFGLAYYSSSTLLNVTLSSMICYRLLRHAQTVKQYLGNRHASPYIAIVGLVVESMLPFTFSSIAFLISYGMWSQGAVVFSFVHPLVMVCSRAPLFHSSNGVNWYAVRHTTNADPAHGQRRGMAEGRNWCPRINNQGPSQSSGYVKSGKYWWEWRGHTFGDVAQCASATGSREWPGVSTRVPCC